MYESVLPERVVRGQPGRGEGGMPREPHEDGSSAHARGPSKPKACVVTLANDLGDSACEVVGRGKPSKGEVADGMAGAALKGSEVTTDSLKSYVSPPREAGVAARNRH